MLRKLMILACTLFLISNAFATLSAEINFDKEKYFSGETAKMTVTITNHGFSDSGPVELHITSALGAIDETITGTDPRKDVVREFDIPLNKTGSIYFDGFIKWEESSYNLEQSKIEVEFNPLQVDASAKNSIFHFSLKNVGDYTLKNIIINFDMSGAVQTVAETEYYISKLTQQETWSKDIPVNVKKTGYIQVNVKYDDEDNLQHEYSNYVSVQENAALPFDILQWVLLILVAILVLKLFVFK